MTAAELTEFMFYVLNGFSGLLAGFLVWFVILKNL